MPFFLFFLFRVMEEVSIVRTVRSVFVSKAQCPSCAAVLVAHLTRPAVGILSVASSITDIVNRRSRALNRNRAQ